MSSTRSRSRAGPATDRAGGGEAGDPLPEWREAGLLLVGLGAGRDPRAAATVRAHAREIDRRGLFAAVGEAFLKRPPSPAEALRATTAPTVYVVPCLIGDSDLARSRVPAALGLDGRAASADGRSIRYCEPIGASRRLAGVIRDRALAFCRQRGLDPARVTLLAVGHGTPRDPDSAATARRHVATLRTDGSFAEVLAAFLEEPPAVGEQVARARAADVVAVGLFVGEGAHGTEDVPALLDAAPRRPGARTFYAGPIGADPGIVEVILAQVRAAGPGRAG